MEKIQWKDDEIKNLILKGDERSYNGRFERLKSLLSIQDQRPFHVPALVDEYYEEARLCWYAGAFVATIVMVQLSFEELLRSHYRVAKGVGGKLNCGKKIDRASFSDLIDEAYNDGWISEEEAKLLHNLRKNIRNPYVHVKDIKVDSDGKPDLKRPNFFTQYLKIKGPEAVRSDAENEAKKAIQLLVTLLPKMSSHFGGL
ncbi:MAG: hypothetical protein J7K61_06315 [Thermoplasmata archaeon]|nr:hypothetical protein [Thermoplasmata archaeon]